MKMACVEAMSDREVVERLKELLGEERRLTAAVLVHLAEVEARQLYRPAACSSMHVYCVRVLGMSEDQAFKRIRAARALRRFPVVGIAVAEGRLHLSGVVLLGPHLTEGNVEALVAEASGKSKAEIEVVVARLAPRPDRPERLEREAEQQALAPEPPDVEAPLAPEPPRQQQSAAKVVPLAPERFALQLTISEATRRKLMRAQALLRHQVPSGDLAELLDRALDALLDKVEGRKFGKTRAPRAAKKRCSDARTVPREVRRQVASRDGMQCSFVSQDGRRCEETGFLELDHVVPVARGGEGSVENVRLLCRTHNQYEAERILGREAVLAGRAARAMSGAHGRRVT
ncbi:MAG TPA: HNH endonuclease signature motif containing protein [Kofleriaceae bacterium]|nr:HNH endonuclease signature motif containing protein [Kofleriaceae bacterium]